MIMKTSEGTKGQTGNSKPLDRELEKKESKKVSKEDQSYWEMMIDGIVRPPRAKYH